ncbi:MAG: hypothetical protein FVQ79_05895 [Planctomycetes bacterium]|nr:hypothetical protein [Planctomycetota bacterium]
MCEYTDEFISSFACIVDGFISVEHVIEDLKQQGSTIAVWGVGTKLVTGYDQSALDGIYKLAAIVSL